MKDFCPHNYQQYCIDRIIRDPALGLFLDMGLGKTAITLTAIKRLKYEYWAVRKVLVIAPKKVAESTWDKEAAKWSHLSCLRLVHVLGSVGQRTAALAQTADVYLINRENVQWLVGYYGHSWPFDMVVIDESSSFKNHQAKRFKALKLVRSRINRIVELTGTPNPRSLMDLWAQVYLLDCGQRLGRTITSYRDAYFVPDKRSRTTIFSYAPKPGAADEIYRRISDICISMKSEDYLDLPELIYEDIPVKLDAAAQKAYDRLERDTLLQVDETVIMALPPLCAASSYSSVTALCTTRTGTSSPCMTARSRRCLRLWSSFPGSTRLSATTSSTTVTGCCRRWKLHTCG